MEENPRNHQSRLCLFTEREISSNSQQVENEKVFPSFEWKFLRVLIEKHFTSKDAFVDEFSNPQRSEIAE